MRVLLAFGFCLLLAGTAIASGDEICNSASGTITVELSNEPGFEGLYKYTILLDKVDEDEDDEFGFFLVLDLVTCECKCEEGFIVFPLVPDTIPGDDRDDHDGSCSISGEYLCLGSPQIPPPLNGTAIRFSGGESDNCDEDDSFSQVSLSFFTPLPPGGVAIHPIILIDDFDDDDGDGDPSDVDEEDDPCLGELIGQLPICDCTVDAHQRNWGSVKSTFEL